MSVIQQGLGRMKAVAKAVGQALKQQDEHQIPEWKPDEEQQRILKLFDTPDKVREAQLAVYEPRWTRNILYTAGEQHVTYFQAEKRWMKAKQSDWLPRPTVNKIQSKVQRVVDFFTRNDPQGRVLPNSLKEDDRAAAELGERIRKHLWVKQHERDKIDDAAHWLVVCGNVFSRQFYDTRHAQRDRIPRYKLIEQPVTNPMTGQPVMDMETGQPIMTTRWIQERDPLTGAQLYDDLVKGDANSQILGPFSITVTPTPGPLWEKPWIREDSFVPLEELRELYPEMADYIGYKGDVVTTDLTHQRLAQIMGGSATTVFASIEPYILQDHGRVVRLEKLPCREFPNGLYAVRYKNMLLEVGDLPLKTRYSYEHCGYYRVNGSFWCRGLVDDLISPQDARNKIEQMFWLHDALLGQGQWLVPDDCDVAEGAIKAKAGLVIRYKWKGPSHKPERVDPKPLPDGALERISVISKEFDELSSVAAVLQGNVPPNVESGRAIEALAEDAESNFSPMEGRWAEFIGRRESAKLDIVQQHYTVPRYLAIRDDDGELIEEISDFTGEALRGNTQFKVVPGSYRPKSRMVEQERLMNVAPILLPLIQSDPGQVQKFLERVGVAGFEIEQSADWKKARWENDRLMQEQGSEEVHRAPSDDDFIHLKVHSSFQNLLKYRELPNEVQARYTLHIIEHLQAIAEKGDAKGIIASRGKGAGEAPVDGGEAQPDYVDGGGGLNDYTGGGASTGEP